MFSLLCSQGILEELLEVELAAAVDVHNTKNSVKLFEGHRLVILHLSKGFVDRIEDRLLWQVASVEVVFVLQMQNE